MYTIDAEPPHTHTAEVESARDYIEHWTIYMMDIERRDWIILD